MRVVVFFFMGLILALPLTAEAMIVISEVHADPASGLTGDANNDGVRSGSDDEFVEIFNFSSTTFNLSGWSLSDAVASRHAFPANTFLNPNAYLVIFGGGAVNLPEVNWQTASSGALGLNNTGDTISLFNSVGDLVDRVAYGSLANNNQSIVRSLEGTEEFVLHSRVDGALFSPGTSTGGPLTVVPEPNSLAMILFGLGALRLTR